MSRTYRVPEVLRRTVLAAYTTCTGPGCTHPASSCDLDHIQPWTTPYGQTQQGNLQPLHRACHNQKTHGRWTATRDQHGHITWTSPLGQTLTVHATDHRPWPERGTPTAPTLGPVWPGSDQLPDEPPF